MKNVDYALASLRDQLGISTLDFDEDGDLTLIFNGTILVNIARMDDYTLEFWTTLEGIGHPSNPEVLRRLLEANYLGEGTGNGCVALAPGMDDIILCERIDLRVLDEKQFADCIEMFLEHAEFWNLGEAAIFGTSDQTPAADTLSLRA